MTERGGNAASETDSAEAGRFYALPSYARKPRQRLSVGVSSVLFTGLAAIGLATFISFSAMFDSSAGLANPAAGPPGVPVQKSSSSGTGGTGGVGVLTRNTLYGGGRMAEVTCTAPALSAKDEASMENFLHEVTDCLDDAWSEQFATSSMRFEPPNRVYWYAAGKSPCGSYPADGTAAFYCRANKGLYLGVEHIVANSRDSEQQETYTFLLSHEYAHHVQGEAGILSRYHSERSEKQDGAGRNAMTRRSELQANCLGGTFLGTVQDSFPLSRDQRANILEGAEYRGDYGSGERTHGSPDNGRMWTAHGMDRQDPAACNTWDASEDLVE